MIRFLSGYFSKNATSDASDPALRQKMCSSQAKQILFAGAISVLFLGCLAAGSITLALHHQMPPLHRLPRLVEPADSHDMENLKRHLPAWQPAQPQSETGLMTVPYIEEPSCLTISDQDGSASTSCRENPSLDA